MTEADVNQASSNIILTVEAGSQDQDSTAKVFKIYKNQLKWRAVKVSKTTLLSEVRSNLSTNFKYNFNFDGYEVDEMDEGNFSIGDITVNDINVHIYETGYLYPEKVYPVHSDDDIIRPYIGYNAGFDNLGLVGSDYDKKYD